ncbi:MAG: V-type sodium ATPase subunit C [Firmicutes bacterium ADurb.Bin182]|nr:MAG: V-type sodium ATPase subunit C [Firmicutes bacterium ADurb.Bin182]
MPHSGPIYGVARIRVLEKGLIGKARMQRLRDASGEECLKLLVEMGYGNTADTGSVSVEELIVSELTKTRDLIDEVTPDKALTDLFVLEYDVTALKLFLKLRLIKSAENPLLVKGVYDTEQLRQAVLKSEYSFLPEAFRNALYELEKSFESGVDPKRISVELDKAYMLHALGALEGTKYEDAKRYFSALADFNNVLALLRLRRMGAASDEFSAYFLPGGELTEKMLYEAYDLQEEQMAKALNFGKSGKAIEKGVTETVRQGKISALEKARDDFLIAIAREGKQDIDTIRPILGFLLAKEQEAKCIRLIVTGKRNRLDGQVITERLRDLYG